ncbi:MAG: helix-turn-helix transcriptional regulator [Candidatus Daviesbacteria bacterium]|nr:helix-turn-helix transcriptional regulator [Candidatus Daviesbacteria bacterium]
MKKKLVMHQDMDWKEYEKILMKRPGFKEAMEETRLEFEIARALIKARIEKGLTQAEIAKRMHTKQSVISRVENARTVPSLSFLKRLAVVLNASLQVQFKF